MFKMPKDIVPGTVLTAEEIGEFTNLIRNHWTPATEYTAYQREVLAAGNHLAYLKWLRS